MAASEQPVSIRVTTHVNHGGKAEKVGMTLSGTLFQKGRATFLKYDEAQPDGTTHTIVKLDLDSALILRSGAVKMRLPFEEGEQLSGSYESPYGTMLLTTKTRTFTHLTSESGIGQVTLDYALLSQGETVGAYTLIIEYELEERL